MRRLTLLFQAGQQGLSLRPSNTAISVPSHGRGHTHSHSRSRADIRGGIFEGWQGWNNGREAVKCQAHRVFTCLRAVYSITTFIRDMSTLLQIRQFAHLRSASCSMQGLSPPRRGAHSTPSRDLLFNVTHVAERNGMSKSRALAHIDIVVDSR
jgi:hypothetical protein